MLASRPAPGPAFFARRPRSVARTVAVLAGLVSAAVSPLANAAGLPPYANLSTLHVEPS
ncbi:hypothetical protein [Paraburkholderia sp. BCC1886]|uniref:hypothetical protein n=1 Tax=Paraburkholderia sp. BCC1886 TaxID=2562670 RepID=UPI001642BBBB|nr:hypothetical protein [Paraburkholderia sp. BCC1886]